MKKFVLFFLFINIINIYAGISSDWKKLDSGVYFLNEKEKNKRLFFLVVGRSSSPLNIDESTAFENARTEALRQYIDYINKLFLKAINEKKYSKVIEEALKNKKITEKEFYEYNALFDQILKTLSDSMNIIQLSAVTENDRYAYLNNYSYEAVVSYYGENNFLEIMNLLMEKRISTLAGNKELVSKVKNEISNNLKEIISDKKFYNDN